MTIPHRYGKPGATVDDVAVMKTSADMISQSLSYALEGKESLISVPVYAVFPNAAEVTPTVVIPRCFLGVLQEIPKGVDLKMRHVKRSGLAHLSHLIHLSGHNHHIRLDLHKDISFLQN